MSGPEQRVHARIHVSTKVEVSVGDVAVEAELKDLSKGGARFEAHKRVGEPGDVVQLLLPSLDKKPIGVVGHLVRVAPTASGGFSHGVRFDAVDPAMEEALHEMVEVLLSATGGGRREHPRVARRIEIRFGQLEDLRGVLEDISTGGLMMTVAAPLVLYEEIDVTVPDLVGGELLILHAKVMNQRPLGTGRTGWRVGLAFTSMRPEARRLVEELLRSVLEELDARAAGVEPGEVGDDAGAIVVEVVEPTPLPSPLRPPDEE